MSQKLSSLPFDIRVGGMNVIVDTMTLTITDNSAVSMTRGVTDGWTPGSCEAAVSLTLQSKQFEIIKEAAKKAGSWQDLEVFDIDCYGSGANIEKHIEAFGVKLKITDLLNIDYSSTDATTHTLEGFVTSPDFVKIDGVPYLSKHATRDF